MNELNNLFLDLMNLAKEDGLSEEYTEKIVLLIGKYEHLYKSEFADKRREEHGDVAKISPCIGTKCRDCDSEDVIYVITEDGDFYECPNGHSRPGPRVMRLNREPSTNEAGECICPDCGYVGIQHWYDGDDDERFQCDECGWMLIKP